MLNKTMWIFVATLLLACGSDNNQPSTERHLSDSVRWLQQNTLDNLIFVEGGTFAMGDVGYVDKKTGKRRYFGRGDDTIPVRQVTLTSYSLLKYEVTYKEYDIYSHHFGLEKVHAIHRRSEITGPNYPVSAVPWSQARAYCQWVGELIGYPMDLLTEAQWEYAARNRGEVVVYATDDGTARLDENIQQRRAGGVKPIGSWPPNPLGIHDMSGNVLEWVYDRHTNYYPEEDQTDPTGATDEEAKKYFLHERAVRGGGAMLG